MIVDEDIGMRDALRSGDEVVHLRHLRERRVYSHGGPIGRRKHGYIPTMDQSDAGSMGIFRRQGVHPARRQGCTPCRPRSASLHPGAARMHSTPQRKHGYIPTMDQSYAGSRGTFPRQTNQTQVASG
eukprot:1188900-Prorocentrum_minimum.AAC.2